MSLKGQGKGERREMDEEEKRIKINGLTLGTYCLYRELKYQIK